MEIQDVTKVLMIHNGLSVNACNRSINGRLDAQGDLKTYNQGLLTSPVKYSGKELKKIINDSGLEIGSCHSTWNEIMDDNNSPSG